MPTVIATAGAVDANSYNTVVEIDNYHATRPSSQAAKWYAASQEDKEAAAITAAEYMDATIPWNGAPATTTQALAFPRTGLSTRNGVTVPSDSLPRELKRAHAEMSRLVLESNRTGDNDVQRMGITDLKVGSISLSFAEDKTSQYVGSPQIGIPKVIADSVLMLIPSSWYTVPVPESRIMLETM